MIRVTAQTEQAALRVIHLHQGRLYAIQELRLWHLHKLNTFPKEPVSLVVFRSEAAAAQFRSNTLNGIPGATLRKDGSVQWKDELTRVFVGSIDDFVALTKQAAFDLHTYVDHVPFSHQNQEIVVYIDGVKVGGATFHSSGDRENLERAVTARYIKSGRFTVRETDDGPDLHEWNVAAPEKPPEKKTNWTYTVNGGPPFYINPGEDTSRDAWLKRFNQSHFPGVRVVIHKDGVYTHEFLVGNKYRVRWQGGPSQGILVDGTLSTDKIEKAIQATGANPSEYTIDGYNGAYRVVHPADSTTPQPTVVRLFQQDACPNASCQLRTAPDASDEALYAAGATALGLEDGQVLRVYGVSTTGTPSGIRRIQMAKYVGSPDGCGAGSKMFYGPLHNKTRVIELARKAVPNASRYIAVHRLNYKSGATAFGDTWEKVTPC